MYVYIVIGVLTGLSIGVMIVHYESVKLLKSRIKESDSERDMYRKAVDTTRETFQDNIKRLQKENEILKDCLIKVEKICTKEQWNDIVKNDKGYKVEISKMSDRYIPCNYPMYNVYQGLQSQFLQSITNNVN